MKITRPSLFLLIVIAIVTGVLFWARSAPAASLSGNILLQVQSKGEAWYVNPADGKRYYLKDGPAAFALMRSLGVGISETDYAKLAKGDAKLKANVSGKIILRVQAKGEAYFLCPRTGVVSYLKDGAAAFATMRQCGLGITNANLNKIPVSSKSAVVSSSKPTAPAASGCSVGKPACDASHECLDNRCQLKSGCNYGNPSCGNLNTCVNNVCYNKVTAVGCAYGNPACSATQVCTDNVCVEKTLVSSCTTPTCADTKKATVYALAQEGTVTSRALGQGDSMPLGNNSFLRVESLGLNKTTPKVTFWHKTASGCALYDHLTAYSGQPFYHIYGDILLGMNNDGKAINVDLYTGNKAESTCTSKITEDYTGAECLSLPSAGMWSVASGVFRRKFKNPDYAPAESLMLDKRNFDYQHLAALFPAIKAAISPDDLWDITEYDKNSSKLTYAGFSDSGKTYVQIFDDAWQKVLSTDLSVYNIFKNNLDNSGTKPTWPVSIISSITYPPEDHELSHSMFFNTQVQEFSDTRYGTLVGEGLADYLEGYGMWSKSVADQYKNDLKCGETTHGDKSTPYTSDYKTDYYTGQCFYYLTADACGLSGLNDAFAAALDQPYHPHDNNPSWFGMLYDHCTNKDRFKQILTNFGIPQDVLTTSAPLMSDLLPGDACSAT